MTTHTCTCIQLPIGAKHSPGVDPLAQVRAASPLDLEVFEIRIGVIRTSSLEGHDLIRDASPGAGTWDSFTLDWAEATSLRQAIVKAWRREKITTQEMQRGLSLVDLHQWTVEAVYFQWIDDLLNTNPSKLHGYEYVVHRLDIRPPRGGVGIGNGIGR